MRDVQRFARALAAEFGLNFDESRVGFLAEVLQQRTTQGGMSVGDYLARLEENPPGEELRALASLLTVSETYFFRHAEQFRALIEVALPARIGARASTRSLSLVSAGCASGEEPYSLSMATKENVAAGWNVSIRALDLNPVALEKARTGRYSAWSLRETPPESQQRWFRADGREFVLDPEVRAHVQFEERNLCQSADVWAPGTHDIVFCRNVLMYFTPEQQQALVERIERSLAPGGFLFLGHAETLRGLSRGFELRHTHDTFYYQRSGSQAAASPPAPSPRVRAALEPDWATTWIETVQRSSRRIHQLAQSAGSQAVPDVVAPPPDLRPALALLREERFADALQSLPSDLDGHPDSMLLRAVLLTHSGQLTLAEEACRRLLGVDAFNAGAHYLLSLCREGAGDSAGAIEHDQVASYLDPAFAMPRLHHGLLARRAGDVAVARRELIHARALLLREDDSRLVLFGGGFGREALLALCGAELKRAGGEAW